MPKEIYSGELKGTASIIGNAVGQFVLKLDEKIEGLPEEIVILSGALAREGDVIWVKGRLVRHELKHNKKEFYIFMAEEVWNVTL